MPSNKLKLIAGRGTINGKDFWFVQPFNPTPNSFIQNLDNCAVTTSIILRAKISDLLIFEQQYTYALENYSRLIFVDTAKALKIGSGFNKCQYYDIGLITKGVTQTSTEDNIKFDLNSDLEYGLESANYKQYAKTLHKIVISFVLNQTSLSKTDQNSLISSGSSSVSLLSQESNETAAEKACTFVNSESTQVSQRRKKPYKNNKRVSQTSISDEFSIEDQRFLDSIIATNQQAKVSVLVKIGPKQPELNMAIERLNIMRSNETTYQLIMRALSTQHAITKSIVSNERVYALYVGMMIALTAQCLIDYRLVRTVNPLALLFVIVASGHYLEDRVEKFQSGRLGSNSLLFNDSSRDRSAGVQTIDVNTTHLQPKSKSRSSSPTF